MQKHPLAKSTLLIVGTSIGTGILALPLATAEAGLMNSLILLTTCFFFMTLGSFYVTEVTLSVKKNADFMTLARTTLGRAGEIATTITYLLLLYALTAMYLMVGAGWFTQLLQENFGVILSDHIGILVFAALLMTFVRHGMRSVGKFNQLITLLLLVVFGGMLAATVMDLNAINFMPGPFLAALPATPLILTSFGFSIVMPVLSGYLNKDVSALKKCLLIGSLITLGAYVLWELFVFGVLGSEGDMGLKSMAQRQDNGTAIILALEHMTQNIWISYCGRIFVILAVLSSAFGVTLSLYHFLKDACSLKEGWQGQISGIILTFAPQVLLLMIYPMGLGGILSLAGLFVAILLGALPALMAWRARTLYPHQYKTPGGMPLIFISICFFCYVVRQELVNILS